MPLMVTFFNVRKGRDMLFKPVLEVALQRLPEETGGFGVGVGVILLQGGEGLVAVIVQVHGEIMTRKRKTEKALDTQSKTPMEEFAGN